MARDRAVRDLAVRDQAVRDLAVLDRQVAVLDQVVLDLVARDLGEAGQVSRDIVVSKSMVYEEIILECFCISGLSPIQVHEPFFKF